MSNVASLLKTEIARLARKVVRADTEAMRKAVGNYRSEIAALKRRADALERQLRHASKGRTSPSPPQPDDKHSGFRFSPKGLASHRKRLGLSASDMGKLLGASGQSVYKWEAGEARPRAANIPRIAAVRSLERRDVVRILAAMDGKD